jgi:hypothetical protein
MYRGEAMKMAVIDDHLDDDVYLCVGYSPPWR